MADTETISRTPARGSTDRLAPHAFFFARQLTPLVIVPLLVLVGALRLYAGDWSVFDLVLVAGLVSVQSATEWCLHRWVLHFGPRTLFGRTVDIHPSRAHRRHHDDPNDVRTVFIGPIGTVVFLVGLALASCIVLRNNGIRLTAVATGLALLLAYEWTHFLMHSAYRPRSTWYRKLWRAHRLHHYRNEHYWFGITGHLFDKIVHTYPAASAVPITAQARAAARDDAEPNG